ncbi:hypothetical protein [Sulfurimonas sp.]|uniref:hypothetical protein n=1 Tax=Sulfurimonas sp. TaxID=2022749 RepID=UPI003D09624D
MGKRYDGLTQNDKEFITQQKLFFIASASNGGEVNLSPRGYDVFRVLGDNEVIFLDYVGNFLSIKGSETPLENGV